MRIKIDLELDGLSMAFKSYEQIMLEHLWEFTDTIPVTNRPEANSSDLWRFVNLKLAEGGEGTKSRASVYFAAERFVDNGIWTYYETTGKGGYHNVYCAKMTKYEFWKTIKDLVLEKINKNL